jgi:hypothetical protein
MNYIVRDCYGGDERLIDALSPLYAAQEYVDNGDYGPLEEGEGTAWVNCMVRQEEVDCGEEKIKVAIHPDEPECCDDTHVWKSLRIGKSLEETCIYCGLVRRINTWAQDPQDGVQGLLSVRFEHGVKTS